MRCKAASRNSLVSSDSLLERCIAHIGLKSAGATTIQRAFHGFDHGGVAYLPNPSKDHTSLVRTAVKSKTPDERGVLHQAIERSDRELILSGDELISVLTPSEVGRFHRAVTRRFRRLSVVAYVPDPSSSMARDFEYRVRRGDAELSYDDVFPSYTELFEKWVGELGKDEVQAVPFSRSAFVGGDIVEDFASRAGANINALKDQRRSLGPSLTAEALSLLFAHRRARGNPKQHPALADANPRVLRYLAKVGSNRFLLDPGRCEAVISRRKDEVAYVEDLMSARLPDPPAPTRGSVVFVDDENILAYAKSVESAFVERVRRDYQVQGDGPSSGLAAMDLLYQSAPPRVD